MSASYSTVADSRPPPGSTVRVRSNFAVAVSTGIGQARPGADSSGIGAFCITNIAWNSGWRLRSRRGASSSTSRSNGRS